MTQPTYKTFRRDKLRRLVEAGRIVSTSTYHFDDMHGESRSYKEMPVKMIPEDRCQCRDGTVYMFPGDFTSGSGSCWQNENGTISLHVHSNSNYTFRIVS